MQRLKEETNGLETTFKLTVPKTKSEALRRHLESLLELMGDGEDEAIAFEPVGDVLPGPELKRLRLKNKITQKGLADALGTTQARISDMEQGVRPITPEQAQKCSELFGVSAKVFLL